MLCAASCIQGSSIHGNKPIAELLHHHVEWDGVARSVNDDHEGFDSELCVEIIGIYLAHQDLRVGLAHGDCDGSCGHVSIEHQLVLNGMRISCISFSLKYFVISCDYWTVSCQGHRGDLCFPNPRHKYLVKKYFLFGNFGAKKAPPKEEQRKFIQFPSIP